MSSQRLFLEAVSVCIGYGDFLSVTLPKNQPIFDHLVIVTSPEDEETREVCRKHSVRCLLTNDHKKNDDVFNKGRCIQRGLDQLSYGGWVVHMDADIVLPERTRKVLEWADLEEDCIYGCDRGMVKSWDHWQRVLASGWLTHDYHCRVNPPPDTAIGTRWASPEHGYVPIGFFQLWHGPSSLYRGTHARPYPQHHQDAARGDVQHALQWDRCKRVLLPELIVLHLESEPAKLGANWKGRTTARFVPGGPVRRPTPSPSSPPSPPPLPPVDVRVS